MSVVTADSIRLTTSDSTAGWGNYNAGGGAPASEPQRVYQGTGVVGRKSNSSTARTGVDYLHNAGTDVTLPANGLVLMKGTVDDAGDLNPVFGLEYAIGTAEGNHYEYNVAGSGSTNDWHTVYNAVGGEAKSYIFAAIDPTVTGWADSTVGTPTLTNIRFFALGAQFVSGDAKNENVGLDAIDVGTGLTYTGTNFSFRDGVDEDQGIVANRWGWAAAVGDAFFLRGLHVVAASGVDTSTVFFPDGMHSTGKAGIQATQSGVELAGSYSGLGRYYGGAVGTDTRPDLTVNGGVSATLSGTFRRFRLANLNAATTVTGTIECVDLIPNGAAFDGATILTDWSAGNTTVDDPDFTLFTSTDFVQSGTGHAIKITIPGTYNIDQLRFSGYDVDGSGGAAILNESGGLVTLERLNAATPTPTVTDSPGSTTEIPGVQTALSITGIPAGLETRFRQGSYTLLNLPDVQTGTATYTYIHDADRPVTVSIGGIADDGTAYERREIKIALTAENQSIPFELILNPSYLT